MSIRTLIRHLYPQLLALHDLEDNIALPNELGQISIPSTMRNSYHFMEANGIYLIGAWTKLLELKCKPHRFSNRQWGICDLLDWICRIFTAPEWSIWRSRCHGCRPTYGEIYRVNDCSGSPYLQHQLPRLESRLSTQVRNILAYWQAQRGHISKLFIARQNLDAAEIEFSDMLVEDQNNGHMSYVDCMLLFSSQAESLVNFVADLTVVHRQISTVVSDRWIQLNCWPSDLSTASKRRITIGPCKPSGFTLVITSRSSR